MRPARTCNVYSVQSGVSPSSVFPLSNLGSGDNPAQLLPRPHRNFSISAGKLKSNREIKILVSRGNAVFLLNSGLFGDGKK